MAATTRWVEYAIDAEGVAGTGGGTVEGVGTRAYSRADAATDKDTFDIGTGNNRLHVSLDGTSSYVTLASGIALDPRFVARDITEKLHNSGQTITAYTQAQCVWENNKLKLYSGSMGSGASSAVVSGTQTAHLELGWGTKTEVGGSNNNPATGSVNNYDSGNSGITVSGTYNGFFDEVYTIVINRDYNIGTPVKGGSNTYTGTMSAAGVFNHTVDITYTIYIDTTNGTTMGGGTGNVPKMSWVSSTGTDDSSADVELLFPDYWYKLGTKGAMVKFSDAVFSHNMSPNAAYTVACTHPQYTDGTNVSNTAGNALYIWGSSRGEYSASAETTSESTFTRLGTRGLYIKFTGSSHTFNAGDQFTVIATPPQPSSYNITNLNYGNVTVSTESPVKSVIFEIMSGAIEMSTVKFGLQSHGSFSHHNANNDDTYFRFGTVGPGQPAGSSPIDGLEWRTSVLASDINDDVQPSYLYATKGNLDVVSDADDSEAIGASSFMGMTSDPIWVNIKLGTSEVGANSTINYRIYFDYS
jgi:hypothetical protein